MLVYARSNQLEMPADGARASMAPNVFLLVQLRKALVDKVKVPTGLLARTMRAAVNRDPPFTKHHEIPATR